jgi:hypothetical protein
MRRVQRINHIHARWHLAVLLLLCAGTASGQKPSGTKRALVDLSTGSRWVLMANPAHPGGPGLLVPEAEARTRPVVVETHPADTLPVIRAGDRVSIDDSSSSLSAHYAAIALAPAALGGVFLARIAAGMAPVRVIALGPGRAELAVTAPGKESRP